jgi:hypothetical protein
MPVEHKSWCWSVWTPSAAVGGVYRSGPRKGLPKSEKRSAQCNCGAKLRAEKAIGGGASAGAEPSPPTSTAH